MFVSITDLASVIRVGFLYCFPNSDLVTQLTYFNITNDVFFIFNSAYNFGELLILSLNQSLKRNWHLKAVGQKN